MKKTPHEMPYTKKVVLRVFYWISLNPNTSISLTKSVSKEQKRFTSNNLRDLIVTNLTSNCGL